MQKYPVRTNHRTNLEPEALGRILTVHFGAAEGSGPERTASWGAVSRIVCRADGKELAVDVTMNPRVAEEVARETIARYNRFLEEVTGFSSKERAKRLRKSATADAPGE